MRDKLLALVALQNVDLEIAALKKNAEAFPREIAELEKQLASGKGAVDSEKQKLEDLDRQRSTLEHTLSEDKDKVKKWETRLTEQRTTREYSALAREIDIAKKGQQTMSEELVELGKQAALQREAAKQKGGDFAGKSKELVERVEVLQGKVAHVEAQVKGLEGKRADAAKHVDSALLRRYDTVRKKRMPAMVAAIAPGVCTGCSTKIPAQQYNSLVASKGFDVCPSCQRIIHAGETLETRQAKER